MKVTIDNAQKYASDAELCTYFEKSDANANSRLFLPLIHELHADIPAGSYTCKDDDMTDQDVRVLSRGIVLEIETNPFLERLKHDKKGTEFVLYFITRGMREANVTKIGFISIHYPQIVNGRFVVGDIPRSKLGIVKPAVANKIEIMPLHRENMACNRQVLTGKQLMDAIVRFAVFGLKHDYEQTHAAKLKIYEEMPAADMHAAMLFIVREFPASHREFMIQRVFKPLFAFFVDNLYIFSNVGVGYADCVDISSVHAMFSGELDCFVRIADSREGFADNMTRAFVDYAIKEVSDNTAIDGAMRSYVEEVRDEVANCVAYLEENDDFEW